MKLEEACTVLGVEAGFDSDDIRKAFRRQALRWHPDKNNNNPECTEQFQRIQTAYAKLTRELAGAYSEDSEDEYYDDYYDDDDEGDEYDCDCLFHGIPPWEFFEQLFAAMESGQYTGMPAGFGGGGGFPFGGRNHHTHTHSHGHNHSHSHEADYDPYYDQPYAYESRDERRHREREEQKLEKMWRKEVEMAERENIRAANTAKAARSVAQERNFRAWLRQMPRPTMAKRTDTSIELVLVRRGVATDELPKTCISKLEYRKNGESSWSALVLDKDTTKATVPDLLPGTSYFFRICGGQQAEDGNQEWGEWSVDSRYATTGKAKAQASSGHAESSNLGDKPRRPNRAAPVKSTKVPYQSAASQAPDGNENGHSKESKEDKRRQAEKEAAIQKALEAAAADYEATQMTFNTQQDTSTAFTAGSSKKKKKKKNKGKAAEVKQEDQSAAGHASFSQPTQAEEYPAPASHVQLAASVHPPAEDVTDTEALLAQAEEDDLARAIQESLAMYNISQATKETNELHGHFSEHAVYSETPLPQESKGYQQQNSTGAANGSHRHLPVMSNLLGQPVVPPPVRTEKTAGAPQAQGKMQQVRSPTICKFFNSDQGCKWGNNCKFQHIDRNGVRYKNSYSVPMPESGGTAGSPPHHREPIDLRDHLALDQPPADMARHQSPREMQHAPVWNGQNQASAMNSRHVQEPPPVDQELHGQQVPAPSQRLPGHVLPYSQPPQMPLAGQNQQYHSPAYPGGMQPGAVFAGLGMHPGNGPVGPAPHIMQQMGFNMFPVSHVGPQHHMPPGPVHQPQMHMQSKLQPQPPPPQPGVSVLFPPSSAGLGGLGGVGIAPPPQSRPTSQSVWQPQIGAANTTAVSGFPGFGDFAATSHGLVAPPPFDMAAHGLISPEQGEGDPDGSLSSEQPQAALDAEAFLNSIQDAPGGLDDGLSALLVGGQSAETVTPASDHAEPAAAAAYRGPTYGAAGMRPRYNPVAPYNPLAKQQ